MIGTRLSEIEPHDPWPVVPGIAYSGLLTFVAGREGHGKSTALRQCAVAVAAGEVDWLGRTAGQHPDIPHTDGEAHGRPVLWIGEESASAIAAAFGDVDDDEAAHNIIVVDPDDVESPNVLEEAVEEYLPDLIVVDPLADLLRLEDERSYTDVRQAIRAWRPPAVLTRVELWHPDHGRYMIPIDGGVQRGCCRWDTDAGAFAPAARPRGVAWERSEHYHEPAMVGMLHCHRDRDARAGGGDQVGAYLGSVGFGSACDLLLEIGLSNRKQDTDTGRYLRVCKSRIGSLRRGDTTHLRFEDGRYVVNRDGVPLLSGKAREAAQIAEETREFLARNPDATKAQALRYLGIARGGTAKYRAFDEAFARAKLTHVSN